MTDNSNPEDTDPYRDRVDEILALQDSDPVRGFDLAKALAPKSVNAMLLLGWAYEHGLGTTRDPAEAEACFRDAAEKGSPMGIYNVGHMHARRGDDRQALECYARSAALGHPPAKEAWFKLRTRDAVAIAKTDPARAHTAFRALAEEGSAWGMLHLASTYEAGSGTGKDLKQAESWYRRVFIEGPDDVKAQASYFLGKMCEKRGDYAKACEMYQYGLDHGFARSIYKMGQLYADGLGVEKDQRKARTLYEQAAGLGHPLALRDLAWQDLSGRFGLINFFRGFPRLLRAIRGITSSLEWRGEMWTFSLKDKNTS